MRFSDADYRRLIDVATTFLASIGPPFCRRTEIAADAVADAVVRYGPDHPRIDAIVRTIARRRRARQWSRRLVTHLIDDVATNLENPRDIAAATEAGERLAAARFTAAERRALEGPPVRSRKTIRTKALRKARRILGLPENFRLTPAR